MKRALVFGCLIVLMAASLTTAQVVTTGTILVIVESQDGSRIPGATVSAAGADVTSRRTAVSDARGEALLVNLEPSAEYVVTTEMSGFQTVKNEKILVRSGQTTTLRTSLNVAQQAEEITVTAETPLVDTTNAVQGTDITLALTESLPTGRSYQSYLQLVPGVLPTMDPDGGGNPASKSGLNYSDIGGTSGASTDNFYFIDGINVTDGFSGTFGANLNTEIIQEQKVLTGGIPAEYQGTPGLLSNVITKSGSNTWHGSVNYFRQDASLVEENKNSEEQEFSRFDSAVTLGGPIVRDRAWFFGSYRRLERNDTVTTLDTNAFLRDVERTDDQLYGKLTWTPSSNDTLSATFASDPADFSGSRDRARTNARDFSRIQGGERFKIDYSRLFGPVVADLSYSRHRGEVSDFSVIREETNGVIFRRTDTRTLSDEQRGGFGNDLIDERGTDLWRAALQWNVGSHIVKAGVEYLENSRFRNALLIGDTKSSYASLAPHLSGTSAGQLSRRNPGVFTNQRFDPFNTSDFAGFMNSVNGSARRSAFYAAFDQNGDGTISPQELANTLIYNSTAGNPHGVVNYDRTFQVEDGPQDFESQGLSFFAQDQIRIGRLTANLGVRAEEFKHFNTLGDNIFTFDWTFAPRVSAVYDILGDGKQKLTAYYGRYYDPIRNNMTAFAGSHSGTTRLEQVYAGGEWVTYRVRGGASLDAIFAPATKTPYTDDLSFGYAIDLGRSLAVETLFTKRWTRDILEDYDPVLYSDPDEYPGPIDHPDSLFLPYTHFGFDESGLPGVANFFIGTLEGGKRDYTGFEVALRRRLRDNWQAYASYTFSDAKGNTNSDSNADFQGDVLFLDPRAPNQYGKQPGSIRHLFKFGGSYRFPFGLHVGGTYRWNSGVVGSKTFLASSRHLPIGVDEPFEFAGIVDNWITPDAVGSYEHPSYGIADVRVEYTRKFGAVGAEIFVDVFNVFNNQDGILLQDLVAGQGTLDFGEPTAFTDPRRYFVGARLSF